MSARALVAIAVLSAVALAATILGGVRHDYVDYLAQWQLARDGLDPWSTNSAYGPLHNAFALLVPLHPLAPKVLAAAALLVANALLLVALFRTRPASDWLVTYLIVFGANVLVLTTVFWLGLNDGFVAALIIGAILARRDGRLILAGVLLGLATLDKYYPALLIPFFALDGRRIEPRLILSSLVTILLGLAISVWLWGTAWLEAVAFGISRDATILSIIRPIAALGRTLGIGDVTDILVHFNGPLVLLVWLAAVALAWVRRDNWLVSACWGFATALLTYKVGNPQFWVSWLALAATLPLLRRPDADRLARLAWPMALFLTLFQLGYIFLVPAYYQGQWRWVNDVAGVPAFALGVWMVVVFLRRRPA